MSHTSSLLIIALLVSGCLTPPTLDEPEPQDCPEMGTEAMREYCDTNKLCGVGFGATDKCAYNCETPCAVSEVVLVPTEDQNDAINHIDKRVQGPLTMSVSDTLTFGVAGLSPSGGAIACAGATIRAEHKTIPDRRSPIVDRDIHAGKVNGGVHTISAQNPGEYQLIARCGIKDSDPISLNVTLPSKATNQNPNPTPIAWFRADTPYPDMIDISGRNVTFWGNEMDRTSPVGWSKFPMETRSHVTITSATSFFGQRRILQFDGQAGFQWMAGPELSVGTLIIVMKLNSEPEFKEQQYIFSGPDLTTPHHVLRAENEFGYCWDKSDNTTACLRFQATNPINTPLVHTITFDEKEVAHYIGDANFPICPHNTTTERDALVLERLGYINNTRNMRGDIAEILVFDRTLSKPERLSFEAYLRTKYQIPKGNTGNAPCR